MPFRQLGKVGNTFSGSSSIPNLLDSKLQRKSIMYINFEKFRTKRFRHETVSESVLSETFRSPTFKAAECFKPMYNIRIAHEEH